VFVAALGAILLIITIVLQVTKLSYDGISESASQVNSLCQSTLGQFGQAISGGFGDSSPQNLCGKAAAIEDWKGVTLWFGIALICGGLSMIGRRVGWWSSGRRPGLASYAATQQTPEAKLAAAERAEANAARLRAQAAQLQAQQQFQTQQPAPGPSSDF
jgi:hypothetical protein